MTTKDVYCWAEYETIVGGETCRVRVRDTNTTTYTITMFICEVISGRFKGQDVIKSFGQILLTGDSEKRLKEIEKLSKVS